MKILYSPRHAAKTCARCHQRPAESPHASRFRLCVACADDVYPGSDSQAYARLVALYAYA